ncbi:hypothetical protein D1816_19460 [Aquimarina sp. AD10]|uniref:hypothetical protein n=1 Tax=Aquimarina sp. AD10 TaxID=1714849 RepID=UPI000E4A600B|nr:hypothetical protein [Aquimarina sp. AD10]AXT62448.1 hypothetical protein D1816_19460 [Aquimarina sp. AD10]RKM90357.1 hypothetical protein D7033_22920 [Aquimarina sp. AD10]
MKKIIFTLIVVTFTIQFHAQEQFSSINLFGSNPTPSVNGFLNKLEFTQGNHGALVFHPGQKDELMFGFHKNGSFYWGTGRSATKKDYYSMYLNGSNGDLRVLGTTTIKSTSILGNNPTPSVNGFLNRLEFKGGAHAALVFHPGQKDELMFGLHQNGNFYWGTGRSATKKDYYSMYLNGNNGNLGIRGKLTSSEVEVKVGGWADFVFNDDYQLPSLEEVENHIQKKGHLANIPSEIEVIRNGINLGEMDTKLLQKIEELTLYTIQQNKELKELKSIIKNLQSKVQDLNK